MLEYAYFSLLLNVTVSQGVASSMVSLLSFHFYSVGVSLDYDTHILASSFALRMYARRRPHNKSLLALFYSYGEEIIIGEKYVRMLTADWTILKKKVLARI